MAQVDHSSFFQKSLVYGCSFVAKLNSKKKLFFFLTFVFFTKYKLFAEKSVLHGEKGFITKNFFTEKNFLQRKI